MNETTMVKCKVIEMTATDSACYDCGREDITKDVSDWNLVTEEEYEMLARFINYNIHRTEKKYLICKQVEDLRPVFERVMEHAQKTVDKEERRNRARKASANKRAATRATNQKKKELALLAELKAKHE